MTNGSNYTRINNTIVWGTRTKRVDHKTELLVPDLSAKVNPPMLPNTLSNNPEKGTLVPKLVSRNYRGHSASWSLIVESVAIGTTSNLNGIS